LKTHTKRRKAKWLRKSLSYIVANNVRLYDGYAHQTPADADSESHSLCGWATHVFDV
jgi:hypothetical protein